MDVEVCGRLERGVKGMGAQGVEGLRDHGGMWKDREGYNGAGRLLLSRPTSLVFITVHCSCVRRCLSPIR